MGLTTLTALRDWLRGLVDRVSVVGGSNPWSGIPNVKQWIVPVVALPALGTMSIKSLVGSESVY